MSEPASQPVVEMRDIVKTFPGVRALAGVSFDVRPGEIHALVGKNGAGKSTLMQILNGLYPQDSGEIYVRGEKIERMSTARAKDVGIALVAQHVKFVPGLSIAENIFGGNLPQTAGGFVDWKRLNREATERLRRFGLEIDVRRKMETVSVAERQMIEIARALFADASVVILDEPTAPLPKHEVQMLFEFVRRLRAQGASFIYISHYLEEVFELADRVTVLRNGELVGTVPTAELTQPKLVKLISGADVERFRRPPREVGGEPVLEIVELDRPGVYEDVTLTLHAGEVVGLTGLEGSGNGALARGLFGLEPMGDGRVTLAGKPYAVLSPSEALSRGVAYLPRDRHGLGIVGIRSVRDNISMSVLNRLANALGFINVFRERAMVQRFVETLGIKTAGLTQPVENLSGGNQQKVVVAKLVATEPRALLLDEPTQGVDVQAKVEILRIVDDLTRRGVAVAIVSDELSELIDMCDRILVFYRGRIVREFQKGTDVMTPERILDAIEGGAEEVAHAVA
ncbi:MAG: sugar ABC transporter ATP-binding protein [Thermomicrobiales bacterium]|nr:sugar ABC transporter ATP-binding protein [Thermomicrobiales bacterium]